MRQIMRSFYWVIGSALVLAAVAVGPITDFRPKLAALLWALACLAGGICVGFLFGIPKILQSDHAEAKPAGDATQAGSAADRPYRPLVNTNLIEISDWLTKIIVGLGLINLKALPGLVLKVARILAGSLAKTDPGTDYLAFSVAVILAFLAMGFLFGYLSTRLYLAAAFIRADIDAFKTTEVTAQAASGAVESLQASVTALTAKVNQFVAGGGAPAPVPARPDFVAPGPAAEVEAAAAPPSYEAALLDLAKQYNDFNSDSYEERVRVRDDLAGRMAAVINSNEASRGWATEIASREGNVGLIAGLATAINAEPKPGDVTRLLRVAARVSYKHARYKVATALGRLFDARLASANDLPATLGVLNAYYNRDSDESLKRRVTYTLAQISRATGQNVGISPG